MKRNNQNITAKKVISFLIFLSLLGIVYSCNQEISVSPPDAPPPHGYVLIDSKPAGAHIYLDGKNRRRITPDSLTWLETNTYTITLKKELYRDTSFTIDAVDGEKKNFFIDYTKNPAMRGKINCNAKPDGSQIFLEDSATGLVTPSVISNLLPGYYKVRYHSTNYRDDSLVVTVSSSNLSEAKTTLVDTTMWMDLNTRTSTFPTNYLTDITIDDNNNLWIGTEDQGLLKFDGNNLQQYSPATSIIQEAKVNSVDFSDDGILWTGTKNGLFAINGNDVFRYNDVRYGTPLVESNILDIVRGTKGHEIFVTPNYINDTWLQDPAAITPGSSVKQQNGISNSQSLWRKWSTRNKLDFGITSTFSVAATDNSGTYYFGTASTGVYIEGPYKQLYNTSNSTIIGNYISAIGPDPVNGGAWIGFKTSVASGTGLSYFNNGTFQPYYVLPNGGNANSIFVDGTGMKWISTGVGLVTFTNSSDATVYNKATTGLEMNDVRGVVIDKLGRVWIATYGGGLILKKK